VALLVSDILVRVRDQHPAFHRSRVTDAVLVRGLSTYQSQLVGKAMLRDATYLTQQASVVFSTQDATGAGVGGFAASVANDGTVSRADGPTGSAKELVTSDAVILVAEFVPASTTTTSVTKTSAGWTTNAYTSAYIEVVAGTGVGQLRVLTGNTSDTASWTDALTTPLDTTSVVRIISAATSVPGDLGVVTALPTDATRGGYLIKLDANGTAYIDLTAPIVATFDSGVPLPAAMKMVVGGFVRFTDDDFTVPVTVFQYLPDDAPLGCYVVSVMNRQLWVWGGPEDWTNVESIELRYVPEPPRLAQLTDYFLLPDHAEDVLVAQGAMIAGARVQGLEGMAAPDMSYLMAQRDRAESAFLSEVSAQTRATVQRLKEIW